MKKLSKNNKSYVSKLFSEIKTELFKVGEEAVELLISLRIIINRNL